MFVLALSVAIGSALFGILGLAFPFAVRAYLKAKLARRRGEFADQLPDCLQIIASALRGGHSLVGSLSVVVDAAGEPMKSEMARVVQEEALGTPLEDALAEVARRMDNTDLDQLGLVARLQRDTGVSAAEVIDRVTETVRERFELRRLVSTLTSQARMSRWIVTMLPVGLLLVISLLEPALPAPALLAAQRTGTARRCRPARHGWFSRDQEDRQHQGLGRTRTCSSSSLVSLFSALGS